MSGTYEWFVAIITAVFILALMGCGEVEHSGTIELDFSPKVKQYFVGACAEKYPSYNESQVDACAEAAIQAFLATLGEI